MHPPINNACQFQSNPPWTKVLYKSQGYPDNYTDKTFLRDLRKNVDVEEVKFSEAVSGILVLLQEVCVVLSFVLIYVYLYNGWADPQTIFSATSTMALVGFVIYRAFHKTTTFFTLSQDMRTVIIFLVFGHLFSPVLHTLTDTISTDTIYTMAFFMMLVHLIFADYGVPAAMVSNSLSLSAAIFASVCLASRLPSAYHAFVLLTVAIECFVLFPFLRLKIRKLFSVTLCSVFGLVYVLAGVSPVAAVLFLGTSFFICLICPLLFTKFQKYKDNIYGPWDEAVIDDADNINDLIY